MKNSMRSVGVLGEAMGELFTQGQNKIDMGIGGDTFNAAVYMAQMEGTVQPKFYSAIGSDPFSQLLVGLCQRYSIGVDSIAKDETRNIGLYSILNDDQGERRFHYWRSESAAKSYLNALPKSEYAREWLACDAVFFSGITLAIMSADARSDLLDMVSSWKGGKVYFDDNYRPTLWDKADVQFWYDTVFNAADVLLLSVEDQLQIQQVESKSQLVEIFACYREKTVILRDGGNPITLIRNGNVSTIEITAVKPIDTTAAGDSFSGTFIALLESGVELETAIRCASKVSAHVVQQPGALVKLPESLLNEIVTARGEV